MVKLISLIKVDECKLRHNVFIQLLHMKLGEILHKHNVFIIFIIQVNT